MKTLHKLSRTWDLIVRQLWDTGLIQSIWRQRPSTPTGRPVPWWSLPAIDFIDRINLDGLRVVEFGSGNSTLWWGERKKCGQCFMFHSYEPFLEYWLEMRFKHEFYHANVAGSSTEEQYLAMLESIVARTRRNMAYGANDLIVVDGPIHIRAKEIDAALTLLSPNGLLVIDDFNWLSLDVAENLKKEGFYRLDLWGGSPGCSYTKLTTLFCRDFRVWFNCMVSVGTPVGGMTTFPGMS